MEAGIQTPSSEKKPDSFFYEEKSGQWVICEELLTSDAQAWAKSFLKVRPPLKSAQLRRFYHDVKSLEAKVTSEDEFIRNRPLIKMLKSKVAYACPIPGKDRKIPVEFRRYIEKMVDYIDDYEDFKAFCLCFEAVVGYFYGEGGR